MYVSFPMRSLRSRPTQASERPLAAPGLTSYRCRGRFGWIMIGAHDGADALREARRSWPEAMSDSMEVWDGRRYVPATS